jgi:hypothetical protein
MTENIQKFANRLNNKGENKIQGSGMNISWMAGGTI